MTDELRVTRNIHCCHQASKSTSNNLLIIKYTKTDATFNKTKKTKIMSTLTVFKWHVFLLVTKLIPKTNPCITITREKK